MYKSVGHFIFIVVSAILLAGCAVGPDFHSPPPPDTDSFTKTTLPDKTVSTKGIGGKRQYFMPGQDLPAEWWLLFHNDALDNLIKRGIANNPNIKSAQAALNVARENLHAEIGSLLLPSVNASSAAQRQRFSSAAFGSSATGSSSSIFNLYNAFLTVSYTLDVFGGLRRQIEASGAIVDYQFYELQATYLALTSNIALTAITEASLRGQIKATKGLVRAQERQLDIVKKQFELGGASIADVLPQQTLVEQTRATLPPLEKELAKLRNLMAVLVGELPSESDLPDFNLDELQLPAELPLSLPSAIVRNRPDILAAEALLHEASAQIGVATANLFPQFTLTGSYGSQTNKSRNLFRPASQVWAIQGQVLQPVFHGGALLALRRAAIGSFEQSYQQYQQTVLQGFENVADALYAVDIDAGELKIQTAAEESARESLHMTQEQYKLGSVNYLFVLLAERQFEQTLISKIQAQATRYADTVLLFQALGGGWWNKEPPII